MEKTKLGIKGGKGIVFLRNKSRGRRPGEGCIELQTLHWEQTTNVIRGRGER